MKKADKKTIASDAQHRWVTRYALAWLLVAQGVCILPLFIYLPFWLPLLWLGALMWRIQIYRGAWPFPSNTSKLILSAFSIGGLVWSYAGAIGVEPLIAFLVVSFVLKLIEARKRSDVLLIIYVGFIAVSAQFLFFQTMFIAIYACLSILLLMCAWNCVYRSHSITLKGQLSSSGLLLLQGLPLMLVLFVVLPRLSSLWHVPIPQNTGKTGFSDTMSPGDFSSLSKSREVAFRVSFTIDANRAEVPERSQWYWRGLVLDEFDGRSWGVSKRRLFRRINSQRGVPDSWQLEQSNNTDAKLLEYNILMEPHQQQWIFTLMAPVFASSHYGRMYFTPNYLTRFAKPVSSRSNYKVLSNLNYRASPEKIFRNVKRRNLELPEQRNPRSVALARQWRDQGLSDREIIEKALAMYRQSFTYTLQPPLLGQESVDDFLFSTQRGFCEHFASSFSVLMRAAGIPARVVLGYQGGEHNPLENYIIVRQSDAHAWAELWLEGLGWVRIDPTAAVSPLRIEQGLEQSLTADEKTLVSGFFTGGLMYKLQLRLDALSYSWHKWVLGYDAEQQKSLFENMLGGSQAWRIGLFFITVVSLFLFGYFIRLTWQGRRRFDYPEQTLYWQLLKRLKKKGFEPEPNDTPIEFAKKIARDKPEWASELMAIARLYNRISFESRPELIDQLRRGIQSIKLN